MTTVAHDTLTGMLIGAASHVHVARRARTPEWGVGGS
jgi:hypothetical protein